MMSTSADFERLFFETLERTLRFWSHVENSCSQAARPNRRRTAQERIANTLDISLSNFFEILIALFFEKNIPDEQRIFLLHSFLKRLADLHSGPLSAVPRPHEPIELVSYIRQSLKSYPDHADRRFSPPHVFATEYLGDQAHQRFDEVNEDKFRTATEFSIESHKQERNFLDLVESYITPIGPPAPTLRPNEVENGDEEKIDAAIGFVSLPRIDFGNPLRWPSLMHEAGHFEAQAEPNVLWMEFLGTESGVGDRVGQFMKLFLEGVGVSSTDSEAEIKNWLVECWCDAHAAKVCGSPALFSQMHAFLFSSSCYLTDAKPKTGYPPAWFRLRLMRALISGRHASDTDSNRLVRDMIAEEWSTLERLFPPPANVDIRTNANLRGIFDYFKSFLIRRFPQEEWFPHSEIDPRDLSSLIEDLSDGLPIPVHRDFYYGKQRQASHGEILLAGWSFRNTEFKKSLLEIVGTEEFNFDIAKAQLLAVVDRADAALQMSIQVSEWFDILKKPDEVPPDIGSEPENVLTADKSDISTVILPSGPLPDNEIIRLLNHRSLRIIPLIDGVAAIAGTVVDVRLGHNFEIFFTNISGAMDALSKNQRTTIDSMEVDYDSLEGLEIAPGQFVLGHTLEYLKLPKDVVAEVNGRSSFARLGIEVHMTAPFVEAGFDGCLTLEIANSGHSAVKLYPGMRIAQLRFSRCSSEPSVSYGDRSEVKYRGRLRHNKTAQFTDWEIDAFKKERERRKR